MEINPNDATSRLQRIDYRPVARTIPPASSDQTDFGGVDRLNQQMRDIPDVRPQVVERGRELVSNPHYPPPEGIRQIARLLALGSTDDTELQ